MKGRRWKKWVGLLIVAVVGGYWFVSWWLSPWRALEQFLTAVARKDIGRLYAMILLEERQKGLTQEGVARAMEVLFYRYGNVQGEVIIAGDMADRWFQADIHWWKVEGEQKKPLPKARRQGPTVISRVEFFRPPWRWRWEFSFTRFVWFLLFVNHRPLATWVAKDPSLRKDPSRLDRMAKEWGRQEMARLLGVQEVLPLPVRTRMRGRMVIFWGKWQEGEE